MDKGGLAREIFPSRIFSAGFVARNNRSLESQLGEGGQRTLA